MTDRRPAARVMTRGAAVLAALICACGDAFTDAATAIAFDLEAAAGPFEQSSAAVTTIVHVPSARRGKCADDYRVQFSRASALVVWCGAPGNPSETLSSHTTTYHLIFVQVPETIIVDKKRGESLSIELAKGPGKPAIERVF